jgi:hypothetical protein
LAVDDAEGGKDAQARAVVQVRDDRIELAAVGEGQQFVNRMAKPYRRQGSNLVDGQPAIPWVPDQSEDRSHAATFSRPFSGRKTFVENRVSAAIVATRLTVRCRRVSTLGRGGHGRPGASLHLAAPLDVRLRAVSAAR